MVMATADAARSKRVGAVIRKRRQVLGWEQRDLAERVGVHVNSVQKWEAGTHYPGRKLGKLEQVLGIRLDEPEGPGLPSPEEMGRLRQHVREVLPPERAAAVEALLDAVMRGDSPRPRAAGGGGEPEPPGNRRPPARLP